MRRERIIDNATAHRASRMKDPDWQKFASKPMSHDEIYKKHQSGEL